MKQFAQNAASTLLDVIRDHPYLGLIGGFTCAISWGLLELLHRLQGVS